MLEAAAVQKLPMKQVGKDAETVKARIGEVWSKATNAEKKAAQALTGVNRVTFHRAVTKGSLNLRVAVGLAQVFKVNPAYLTGAANARGTCSEKNLSAFLAEHGVATYQNNTVAEQGGASIGSVVDGFTAVDASTVDMKAVAQAMAANIVEGTKVALGGDDPETKMSPEPKASKRGAQQQTKQQSTKNQSKQPSGQRKQAVAQPEQTVQQPKQVAAEAAPDVASISKPLSETKQHVSPATQKFIDTMTDDDMAVLLKSALLRAKANMPEAVKTVGEIKRMLLSIG